MKKALITGITGQDGSYLAELLLEKGCEVHGLVRRVASSEERFRYWRIWHIRKDLLLHGGSLESYASVFQVIQRVKPEECYHLAAQSSVPYSFEDEFSTFQINLQGTHHLLASLKQLKPDCRFYFAGTSEMFGGINQAPQDESTPFHPRSAYGISKVAGFHLTRHYREAYKLFAVSGIAFNHESPRRGFEFVTRKISTHVARIKMGLEKELPLGNLEAKRDWGHAKDYVRGMWLMLQSKEPKDYVLATGQAHTVREFCELAFRVAGLRYEDYVVVDPALFRPAEVHLVLGNAAKAREELGWEPTVSFEELVKEMVEADCRLVEQGVLKGW